MEGASFVLRARSYLRALVECSIVFFPLYAFTNSLAEERARYKIFWQWELSIPLIPEMMLFYMSLNFLMVLPLFLCEPAEIKLLGRSLIIGTVVGAVFFLLLPSELGFIRPSRVPLFESLFHTIYSVDKPHNLFPSLHVTFSSIAVMAMASKVGSWVSRLLVIWLITICFSVVLVWQHHVSDVIAGLALAAVIFRFYYCRKQRLIRRSQGSSRR